MSTIAEQKENQYKILVFGGKGVGKSAIVSRIIMGNFPNAYDPSYPGKK
jgi:GTPase SAR1 family protein